MSTLRVTNTVGLDALAAKPGSSGEREILEEDAFKHRIAIEQRRTERSKQPFLLMLLRVNGHAASHAKDMERLISALIPAIRETDVVGWYWEQSTIGVVFTCLSPDDCNASLGAILARISSAVRDEFTPGQFGRVNISCHFFPDDWDGGNGGEPRDPSLYPDSCGPGVKESVLLQTKRMMDIAGAAFLVLMSLPFSLVIAALIKATSDGPILFKQQRVGQYGRCFTFLKFRSMYVNNDHSVHKDYVTQLIAGHGGKIAPSDGGDEVYKLANDQRITRIGRFLRKTSLDELPQFLNVLCGDMSLVGPRPPIPYELAAYQTWHRRRLLKMKPGITGLWQVTGRSKVTFDDMVRLDLRYAAFWSPWLDLRILMRTPVAVIKGAY